MARPLPGPRTVSQLKRSVLHPSTTSNYICRFQPPNNADSFLNARLGSGYYSGDQQEKLEISCVEASLPGSSLATYDIDNAFHGVTEKFAYRKVYDDRADFTFIVDRDYYIVKFFENWISYIAGENDLAAQQQQTYSYKVNYPADYRTDNLYITKFEKDYVRNSKTLTYKFIGAYPISIVSMPISYEQSQLLKCTVSFTYLRYVMNPVNEPKEVIADSAILQAPPEPESQKPKNPSYPENTFEYEKPFEFDEYYNNFGDDAQDNTNFGNYFNGRRVDQGVFGGEAQA